MSVIDNYLKNVSEPQKLELQRVSSIIKQTVPDAVEVITYGMPGFKYKGKYLIAFAPFKKHMSVFPGGHAVDVLSEKLKGYKVSKGTIQFTIDNPLSESLIKDILAVCMADILET